MQAFECARCHETFYGKRSAQECWDELLDTVSAQHLEGEEFFYVCDPCYQFVMARVRAEAPEILREEYR